MNKKEMNEAMDVLGTYVVNHLSGGVYVVTPLNEGEIVITKESHEECKVFFLKKKK
ncbi:hypothetical protein [Klebsiella pasteurii]|uniref:hypothetical protein n=1 Tax=Klebsiella pasteurii TaxID=2587529 RepID=UPI00237B25A1|nr:hypothetical protein [Klebsiella pasteurii]MDD9662514.1 hypothetical protein [Klebsiella pasteurii]MDD9667370.1 hypothetical protein [Klebsiella pasteurii]MDD9686632.1 hypothetical protein [Klebsiella pasteurii]